jgi:hypothetical protein
MHRKSFPASAYYVSDEQVRAADSGARRRKCTSPAAVHRVIYSNYAALRPDSQYGAAGLSARLDLHGLNRNKKGSTYVVLRLFIIVLAENIDDPGFPSTFTLRSALLQGKVC